MVNNKKLIVKKTSSKCPHFFNRKFYKYYYRYILLTSTNLRKNLYKRQIWQSQWLDILMVKKILNCY